MRILLFAAVIALGACAAPGSTERLRPADSATELIVGGPLTMRVAVEGEAAESEDALVRMTLTAANGQVMNFTEANHSPYDVMAQAAGGPLANVMGFFGEEAPTLYASEGGSPFICQPDGPAMLGVHRSETGQIKIVGLRSGFEFEPRASGGYDPVPYSPDHVCARLIFRRG